MPSFRVYSTVTDSPFGIRTAVKLTLAKRFSTGVELSLFSVFAISKPLVIASFRFVKFCERRYFTPFDDLVNFILLLLMTRLPESDEPIVEFKSLASSATKLSLRASL